MPYENLPDTETSKLIIESYLAVDKYTRATGIARSLGELVTEARPSFEPDDYKNSGEDRWLGMWLTLRSSIELNGLHADPEHVLKAAQEYIANPILPKDIPTETL